MRKPAAPVSLSLQLSDTAAKLAKARALLASIHNGSASGLSPAEARMLGLVQQEAAALLATMAAHAQQRDKATGPGIYTA